MEGTSVQVRRQVRDSIEQGFDTAHRVTDLVTFPLAPLDGAVHGVARGVFNWLTDRHPEPAATGSKCAPPAPAVQPTSCKVDPAACCKPGPQFGNHGNIGAQNNTTGDNNKLDARISGPMNFGNPRGY